MGGGGVLDISRDLYKSAFSLLSGLSCFLFGKQISVPINWNWRTIIVIHHQYLIFNIGKACCFPPVRFFFLVSPNYLHPSEAREKNQITFSVVGVYTKNYTRSVQNIILSRLSNLKLGRSMVYWYKMEFPGPGENVLALSDRCQLCLRSAMLRTMIIPRC